MKRIIKFLFLAAFCVVSLKSSNLLAIEAPRKNYWYGVVENKSSFPVRVRVINKDGGERFYELGAEESSVVPLNTKVVEVYYHESTPVGVTEKLDVEVYQSDTLRNVKKVPGFGDTVTFDEPTGAFPPSYLTPDYPATVLPGASYPDEEGELNLMRLKHKNPSIRAEGASELGRLKSVKAVEPLIESMEKDKDMFVKMATMQALGKIGNKESVKALRQVLNDKGWFGRGNAAEALTNIEGDEAISVLKEAARNDDGYVRKVAIEELIKRKNQDIVDSFKDALKDKSENVRADAVAALGVIGGEDVFDDLTAALKDKDFFVRYKAVQALGKTGNEQAKDALKEALAFEHNSSVRDDIQWELDRIEARAKKKKLEAEVGLRDEGLIKLNEDYMANEKEIERLEKENPTGEEIKLRRRNRDLLKEQFDERAKRTEEKHGPAWRDNYRKDGKLPGGLLEDNKSILIKLNDAKKEKEEKVKKLRDQFEELKKAAKPVETWEDRLLEDQRKLREDFVKEHGESSGWTDEVRKEYENALNGLTQKSRKKWEEDKKSESENNRKLGKTIKELAEARAELNQMDEVIELQDKRIAEKPSTGTAIPFVIGEDVGLVKAPYLDREGFKYIEPNDSLSSKYAGDLKMLKDDWFLEDELLGFKFSYHMPNSKEMFSSGVTVTFIEGYAEDQTDGTIGYWNAKYPHPSFDDEEGRQGKPNGKWDGYYYFAGDTLYLVINNLRAEWPPSHTLSVGYTVTLSGGTFEDGSVTKSLILYTYSGTPGETRIVKGFNIKRNR